MKNQNSKRILMVFPLEIAAHYLRCLEFCKRLKGQYEIRIAYSGRYEGFIRKVGLKTFEVENFDPADIKNAAARFDFSWINRESIERVLYSQIKIIEECKPDFVLGDTSLPLKMAAEKTSTKFISLLNGYMTKYYRLTRKVSRKHLGYKYSKKMPEKVFDLITRRIEYASFRKIHEPFRIIRKDFGLSPQSYFLDEFEGDINIICDLPDLFPQKKLLPTYGFVGPLFYRNDDVEKEVLDFIGGNHPNILVTAGSSGNLDKVAFLNDPIFQKYRIVVSGDVNSILHGPNIISRSFINHISILPKIDIAICHGGNGTIYQALSCGVPVLCIPSNFENEWNADRIEELGLGVFIDDMSDVKQIDRLIESWIEKRSLPIFTDIKNKISKFLNRPIDIVNLQ